MKILFFRKFISPSDVVSNEDYDQYLKSVKRVYDLDHSVNSKEGIENLVQSWRSKKVPESQIKAKIDNQREILMLNAYAPRLSKSLMYKWAQEDNAKVIHYAVINNDLNLIRSLVSEFGIGIMNATDSHNSTPLDYAIRYNKYQFIPTLVNLGASRYNDKLSLAKLEKLKHRIST